MKWILAAAVTVTLAVLLARRASASAPASATDDGNQQTTLIEDVLVHIDPSTYIPANVDDDMAARNVAAFLATIRVSEGTERASDPYRVTFGYKHTLADLSDHPYFTGEWKGASFTYTNGNGERVQGFTTAAGAYQFLRRTWADLRDRLQLPDFGPASQDRAAVELIRQRGALLDVQAGRFADAVARVRPVWASLPGAGYGQPERTLSQLADAFEAAGGTIAA